MIIQHIDPFLVIVLLLNFYSLVTTRLRPTIRAVALQGILLGLIYPFVHEGSSEGTAAMSGGEYAVSLLRLLSLTAAMVLIKGVVIPRLLFRAMREVPIADEVEAIVGYIPTLLIGGVGTALSLEFAETLPLIGTHTSTLIVPAALATVFIGFVMLTTRRKFLSQVLGYLILENGIFIFGLLLVEAMPLMVEVGVLLDLFVGVFVMGIIINHVSRGLPATYEPLLKE